MSYRNFLQTDIFYQLWPKVLRFSAQTGFNIYHDESSSAERITIESVLVKAPVHLTVMVTFLAYGNKGVAYKYSYSNLTSYHLNTDPKFKPFCHANQFCNVTIGTCIGLSERILKCSHLSYDQTNTTCIFVSMTHPRKDNHVHVLLTR